MPSTVWKNLTHCWYDLVGGVKSTVRWLPITWFDRDWDWIYLAKLIEVKCTRMAKVMEMGYHENGQFAASQLREVSRLLSRVQEDDYLDEISGPLITHSGWIDSTTHPGYKQFYCEQFKPDGSKVSNQEYIGWVMVANQTRERELKIAMRIIANYMFQWWD